MDEADEAAVVFGDAEEGCGLVGCLSDVVGKAAGGVRFDFEMGIVIQMGPDQLVPEQGHGLGVVRCCLAKPHIHLRSRLLIPRVSPCVGGLLVWEDAIRSQEGHQGLVRDASRRVWLDKEQKPPRRWWNRMGVLDGFWRDRSYNDLLLLSAGSHERRRNSFRAVVLGHTAVR